MWSSPWKSDSFSDANISNIYYDRKHNNALRGRDFHVGIFWDYTYGQALFIEKYVGVAL